MTLLELVIIAHRCRSTHHYIALDALQILAGSDAGDWKNLMLRHHEKLLKGAKAPDAEFKDFRNHVLHVGEGEWGGARDAAMLWYGKSVEALRAEKWGDAAYALGVLTHYYADPIQPFHTAQTEEEGAIHRALEWSIAKSRDTIKAMIDAKGYPVVHAGYETGFVADMVLEGARYSNPHYRTFIDHYDIDRGVIDPPTGLDQTLLDIIADLVAYATAGVATLFERAFAEAGVKPQKVDLDLPGYLAALDIPIRRITKKMSDASDRKTVEAMYNELLETGKVIKTLPADDKKIRALHAKQVLRKPIEELDAQPLEPIGTKHTPREQTDLPVRYELKVVPVVINKKEPEFEPLSTSKPAPIIPDPVVFDTTEPEAVAEDITAPEIVVEDPAPEPEVAAKVEIDSAPEPEIIEAVAEPVKDTVIEQAITEPTPAEAVLAEIDAESAAAITEAETVADVIEPSPEPEIVQTIAEAPKPEEKKPAKSAKAEASVAVETERLNRESPVVDAPSIGPKTAARLEKVNIVTIGDLLDADAEETANALNVRYIKKATLKDWQDQTRLMLEAPGLRVLDSQILVGAGIRDVNDLAKASATKVLNAAKTFLDTPQGARVLWGGENNVDKAEVSQWIDLAKSAKG